MRSRRCNAVHHLDIHLQGDNETVFIEI